MNTDTPKEFSLESPKEFSFASSVPFEVSTLVFGPHDKWLVASYNPIGFNFLLGTGQVVLYDLATGKELRTFSPSLWIKHIAVSYDGRWLLTAGHSIDPVQAREERKFSKLLEPISGLILWDISSGQKLRSFGTDIDFSTAVFSPNGRYIIAGGTSHRAEEKRQNKREELDVLLEKPASASNAQHSSDPTAMDRMERIEREADAIEVGLLRIWDISNGQKKHEFQMPERVVKLAVSGDDLYVLAADRTGHVYIWDLTTGKKIQELKGEFAAFLPGGRILGDFVKPGVGRKKEEQSYLAVQDWPKSWTMAELLAVSSCEKQLLIAGTQPRGVDSGSSASQGASKRKAFLVDLKTGRVRQRFGADADAMGSVAFSPSGKHFLCGDNFWDATNGLRVRSLVGGPIRQFTTSFGVDGKRFALVSPVHAAKVFATTSGKLVQDIVMPNLVTGTLCQNGKRWFLATRDGTRDVVDVTLWDTISRQQLFKKKVAVAVYTFKSACSPDGTKAVVSGKGRVTTWWNRSTGQKLPPKNLVPSDRRIDFPGHDKLVMSSDGRMSVSLDRAHRTVVLRDTATGKTLRTLRPDSYLLQDADTISAGFDQSGDAVFAEVDQFFIELWELDSLGAVHDLLANQQMTNWVKEWGGKRNAALDFVFGLNSIAFSNDSRYVATAFNHGPVIVSKADSGRKVRTFEHSCPAMAVAFDPSNRKLLVGCADNTAILYELATGARLQTFRGHQGPIDAVAFRPGGRQILTISSMDATARLWDVATGREVVRLLSINDRKDWLVTTPEGLFDGSAGGREKVGFRVGGGLNVVPVDRFFQDFYYPGLLAAIWQGERPLPKVQFGDKVPPTVRIVSPKKGGGVENDKVAIEIEVIDRGGGIEGPWVRQNGMKLVMDKQTERDGTTLRQKFELMLVEGKNEIEIQAASADGAWESEPARIAFDYQQPPRKSDLYIISIGVGDYPGKKLDLKYARTDAEAMAELFASRGPTLYANIYQTNLKNEDATKQRILAAIRTVAGKASPRDTVVLFLAGHGAMVDNQYYFLPGDFEVGDLKWNVAVMKRALATLDVGQAITTVPALKRLLVFDTGQSGVVTKETTARNPFAFRGAIERLGRSQGGFTIASCSSTKDAHEIADLRHGILTYSLLAGMKAANGGPLDKQWIEPDAEDRVVRVLQWFGFADSHVPRLTQEFFGHAQPVQHSSTGISFPVLPVPRSGDSSHSQTNENARVEELRPVMTTRFDIGGSSDKADLYLVAVGINEYANSALNLEYARPDAEAIIKLFRQRAPAIYENIHVVPLLDKKATKRGIIEALEQVAKKAGPEDTLMLFISGHGKMVGQRYYLITHEFKKGNGLLDAEISAQCLPVDEIGDGLSRIQAKKRLLVFDTCASGGALGLKQGAADPFAFRGAIDRLGAKQGTFAIAASAASEEAQEHDSLGHGVLTYTLLAGLDAVDTGPLDHRSVRMTRADGLVDVFQWFSFASGQAPRLMKQLYGREQFIQTSGKGVSFPVLPLSSLPTHQPATADETSPVLPSSERTQSDKGR